MIKPITNKSPKNLCITLPTTATLVGQEVKEITDSVIINETALRFLDAASVSPSTKNVRSTSDFFHNTLIRSPKSVQSSRRAGEYEIKFIVDNESTAHKADIEALAKRQDEENAKRRKAERSLQRDTASAEFDLKSSPFSKAYYRIAAQSGIEHINASTVQLPPITSKMRVIETFQKHESRQRSSHTTSLPLCFGGSTSAVPDLRNGRVSGVLLSTAAFRSYNYDLPEEDASDKDPALLLDPAIATYAPSTTVNDIREMKRIYAQLEELSDGSGYTYCVGGLSFYEVMLRVVSPKKPALLQSEVRFVKKGVPFNPVRRKIVSLCQKISFERGIKARELLFDNKARIYPKSFDDVWPSGVVELLVIIGASGSFSSIEHVNLPVGYGSNYANKSSEQVGKEGKSQDRKTPWAKQNRDNSLEGRLLSNRQGTRLERQSERKADTGAIPLELLYDIQDQLFKHLDTMFRRPILELIMSLNESGFLTRSNPVHAKLLDIYGRHQLDKPASPIIDPEGRQWVSCHITERTSNGPSFSDIYRYLEGFILVADWAVLHNGIAPDTEECSIICTKIVSPITASLSLCISRLLLHSYFIPFVSVMSEDSVKSEIQEVMFSKGGATTDDLILDLLRRQGKALTELELSKYRNRSFGPLIEKLCKKREEAIADVYTKEQIHNIRVLVQKLKEASVLPNIVDPAGAHELIEYISSVMLKMDMSTLSTSLFRVLRGRYLTKFKAKCALPTVTAQQRHLSFHMHICILAAKVAALKVVEELYPLHIHTHIGRLLEYEALSQIDDVIDPSGTYKSIFDRLVNAPSKETSRRYLHS